MLIGLAGYIGSGKSTVGDLLVKEYGFTNIAFADPLKKALEVLDPIVLQKNAGVHRTLVRLSEVLAKPGGWDQAKKDPEVRRLLQVFGTEIIRDLVSDEFWVKLAEETISGLLRRGVQRVVVTDVRFENEAEMLLRIGGVVLWVERPGSAPSSHRSESVLCPDRFPRIRNDSSLETLRDRIRTLADIWKLEPSV